MNQIIIQPVLCRPLLTTLGPKEYRKEVALFKQIDALISGLNLDIEFAAKVLNGKDATESKKSKLCSGFRILIARMLLGTVSARELSRRLADSQLQQWFCRLGDFGEVKTPSKSEVDRLTRQVSLEEIEALGNRLLQAVGNEQLALELELEQALELSEVWFDATCVKANIHYPTDWVLLSDATRTLMKAVDRIRSKQVRSRMLEAPASFISRMNTLCINMAQLRGKKGAKRKVKKVLRRMVKLVRRCATHAQKHMEKMIKRGENTGWSVAEIAAIEGGIRSVLDQLPTAIEQAESRILKGKMIPSSEKILSLYEKDIHVIKRGKGNAQLEFGNVLMVGEQREGLILEMKLHLENRAEASIFQESVEATEKATKIPLTKVCTDRGFHSAENESWLAERKIKSFMAPRGVAEYQTRQTEEAFRQMQQRRAQTEARIAILRYVILGGQLRSKGFKSREKAIGWAKLAHNLWVVARLIIAQKEKKAQAA